jgi:hypothetical protein
LLVIRIFVYNTVYYTSIAIEQDLSHDENYYCIDIKSFETERLRAIHLEAHDLDKMILMHNNSAVMATLGGVRTEEQTTGFHYEQNIIHANFPHVLYRLNLLL